MIPNDSPGQDQYHTIQNLQKSPIPQSSNWPGTFLLFRTANRLYFYFGKSVVDCSVLSDRDLTLEFDMNVLKGI